MRLLFSGLHQIIIGVLLGLVLGIILMQQTGIVNNMRRALRAETATDLCTWCKEAFWDPDGGGVCFYACSGCPVGQIIVDPRDTPCPDPNNCGYGVPECTSDVCCNRDTEACEIAPPDS